MVNTSYTIKTDPSDKIWFTGEGSGGKWWDLFFCGLFNSYFAQGASSTKKVYLEDRFGLQVISTKSNLEGLYFLTKNENEIVLKKFKDGNYEDTPLVSSIDTKSYNI
jgi:hypothetical protein